MLHWFEFGEKKKVPLAGNLLRGKVECMLSNPLCQSFLLEKEMLPLWINIFATVSF